MKIKFLAILLLLPQLVRGDQEFDLKAKKYFELLDENHDGRLSFSELGSYESTKVKWLLEKLPREVNVANILKEKASSDFYAYAKSGSDTVTLDSFTQFLQQNDKAFELPAGADASTNQGEASNSDAHKTLVDKIKGGKFHIVKSSTLAKDSKQPARLSWTTAHGKSPVYALDIALTHDVDLGDYTFGSISESTSVEAHTSNDTAASQDSISAKLAVKLETTYQRDSIIQGNFLQIAPVYESDRKALTRTIGGSLMYSPKVRGLHIGSSIPFFGIRVMWRPYVGIEYGHVLRADGTNPEVFKGTNNYNRAVGQVDVLFDISSHFLVNASYSNRTFLNGGKKSYDYVEVSPTYLLGYIDTDSKADYKTSASVGVTYKSGMTTPKFTTVNSFMIWLGFQK